MTFGNMCDDVHHLIKRDCRSATKIIEVTRLEAEARFQVQARGPVTPLPGVACEYGTGSQRTTVYPWEHPQVTCGDYRPKRPTVELLKA